jgi:nucleoid DNA-binding protein
MNKSELIEHIASETGSDKASAGRALDAVLKGISDSLAKGESVALAGFGTFETRERAARTGRNPQTGETMEIAASTSAGFKPASALKKAING